MIEMRFYKPIFRRVYEYMAKYVGVIKSGDFAPLLKEMAEVTDPLEKAMYYAVAEELERKCQEENVK